MCYRMGCLLIQAGYINKLIKKNKMAFQRDERRLRDGSTPFLEFPSPFCSLLRSPLFYFMG